MNKNDPQFEEPKDRHKWRNRIKGKYNGYCFSYKLSF